MPSTDCDCNQAVFRQTAWTDRAIYKFNVVHLAPSIFMTCRTTSRFKASLEVQRAQAQSVHGEGAERHRKRADDRTEKESPGGIESAGGNRYADRAVQDSVTMPGVRRSRSGSTIRFILDAARWCWSRSGGSLQARNTWSWFSQTARSLWSRPGWQRQRLALPLSLRALGYRLVGSSNYVRDSILF